ncbi:MAG: bifunctional phosphoribosyl-AMP cyclohydrolase/phosphoribosyl-ATP diphosphatase HisIE [Bacteroidales bacterium]|nr:bifunctional phosphoribosyl-AMP cyclohydrolase/phosphoribosyl-ATP diphosphatase HisIE [Bacteroidales bacterium]
MQIDFDKLQGLVPAVIQDAVTNKVLMLGFMNREAYEKTVQTGLVTFWSRTRNCLWTKGETSGNVLRVVKILNDCDNDTLLIKVNPAGPVCHTGADTCWNETNERNPLLFLTELQDFINKRHEEMPEGSYTTSLFKDGLNRMAQKVGEEALELVIEATNGTNDRLIYEGSDMLYHLIVLLTSKGLRIEDMATELAERHQPGWKKH